MEKERERNRGRVSVSAGTALACLDEFDLCWIWSEASCHNSSSDHSTYADLVTAVFPRLCSVLLFLSSLCPRPCLL